MTKEILSIGLQISEDTYNVLNASLEMYKKLLQGDTSLIFKTLNENGFIAKNGGESYNKGFMYDLKLYYFTTNFNPVDKGIDSIINKLINIGYSKDINLELTEDEYNTVLNSLDLYGRILMGQTNVIEDKLMFNGIFCDNHFDTFMIADGMKLIYFSGKNISLSNAPTNAKRARELYANMRYQSGRDTDNVWGSEPLSYLDSENITVKFN